MCQRKSHYQDLMKGGISVMSLLKLSQEPRSGGRFLNLAESCCQGCSSVNPMNHPTWSIPKNPITQIENRWELGWPHPLISFGSVWTSSRKRQAPLKPYLSPYFSHYIYIIVSLPVLSPAISLFISLYFSSILPISLFLSWLFSLSLCISLV